MMRGFFVQATEINVRAKKIPWQKMDMRDERAIPPSAVA
jgi:hypothetical protein